MRSQRTDDVPSQELLEQSGKVRQLLAVGEKYLRSLEDGPADNAIDLFLCL